MTRVLVLGKNGQLARALAAAAWPEDWRVRYVGREALDLAALDGIGPFLTGARPDVVINTAAYTAVDEAEREPEAARRLNAEAPARIAQATRRAGSLLVHLSTDYVFGAAGPGPFAEDAAVAPANVYGRSKAEGEAAVLATDPNAVVVRTAWLLSPQSGFVRAILRQGAAGRPFRVVEDQQGNPTRASDLAAAIIAVAQGRTLGRGAPGLLHAAGCETATWFQLARALVQGAGLQAAIEPIRLDAWPSAATRPPDSRLSVRKLATDYGLVMPGWSQWVAELAQSGPESVAQSVETRQQSGAGFQFPGEPG